MSGLRRSLSARFAARFRYFSARAAIACFRRSSVAASGWSSCSRARLTVAFAPSSEIRIRRGHLSHVPNSTVAASVAPAIMGAKSVSFANLKVLRPT